MQYVSREKQFQVQEIEFFLQRNFVVYFVASYVRLNSKRAYNKTISLPKRNALLFRFVFTFVMLIMGVGKNVYAQLDTVIQVPLDTADFVTEDLVESEVFYFGKDSTRMDLANNALFLFGEGSYVQYGNLEVKAAYIRFSFSDYTAFAKGTQDSLGKWVGRPVFSEGEQSFEEDSLAYHFKTKRGISYGVRTEEASAYLHSEVSKK